MEKMGVDFWRGKRVLLTGHTGFKGSWLALWLEHLGARICGIALDPNTTLNLFSLARVGQEIADHRQDIRNFKPLHKIITDFDPEIVFHLAAQPLVRASYLDPLYTYETNVLGTANVLQALRDCPSLKTAIMVTTDKVYAQQQTRHPFKESDPLGGHDPYSASKSACEMVIQSFAKSFFSTKGIGIASARSGNVIGGGDWSEDRLVPDAIKAWSQNKPLTIRNPDSVRPWQHILDPLYGYMILAQRLYNDNVYSGAWNFGPTDQSAVSVRTLIELARKAYGCGEVKYETDSKALYEAEYLMLDTSKAYGLLGFRLRWNLEISVEQTMRWYHDCLKSSDARTLCLDQIALYEDA